MKLSASGRGYCHLKMGSLQGKVSGGEQCASGEVRVLADLVSVQARNH